MRQLVKINKINKLIKHPNADRLQIASVGLWEVITSVGQFEELDDALYCEIDSLLPLDDPRFAFLIGRNQYNIDGKEYSRLKTMRLRKALSQGLLLPIKEFQKEVDEFLSPDNTRSLQEIIGIIKYDPPEYSPNGSNASRSGPGKPFPYFVPKTDQERIQNITEEYRDAAFSEELFEITYKLDGSSITMYVKDNTLGVCSRNFEFNIPFDYTEWPNIENHFIKAALAEGVLFKLILAHSRLKHNFALQGELCIAKGTLISTPHGLIPIEEINTNDEVYSNGEITNVCKVFNNGIKNTFLYTLDTGASIRMTPEHRVFVFDKTGKLYKKAIKDVSPDEYLVTYLNSPSLNTDYINLMHDTILVDDYSSRKNTCDFPNILNEEFAYFLGIFYAEGCVINNNKKNLLKLSITLHKDEINISNRIKAFLDTVFIGSHGFNERVLESVNTRIIEIYSVDFVYYLSQNGFLKEKSDSLIFPELINISPQSVINAFISGFLDGDGDSCVKKLRISSNSASFLKMIQFHMLNVGCPTYLRCRANSNGKVLYGYNILSFIDNYNTLLSQSFKWQNGDKPIKSYYSYPFKYCDSLEVDEKVKIMSNINNGIYRLGNTSFNNLKKIIELSSNENLVNYFKLVSKHFLPTKIVSVSNEQLVQVYDLQVNNESHSYVANSLYVSNCGPGIQSNFEGLNKHEIYIYDVYDIDNKRYMTPHGRRALLEDLDIKQVPVFKYGTLDKDIHKTLEMADGPSGLNGKFREGLVFKSLFRDFSFKAIGNSYLEKTDR